MQCLPNTKVTGKTGKNAVFAKSGPAWDLFNSNGSPTMHQVRYLALDMQIRAIVTSEDIALLILLHMISMSGVCLKPFLLLSHEH